VNIHFCTVIAEKYQGWSTCQDYIEIKTDHIKKNNLEDSGRNPWKLGPTWHRPGVAASPPQPMRLSLSDPASTDFEDE
jgi:hypothetical protein